MINNPVLSSIPWPGRKLFGVLGLIAILIFGLCYYGSYALSGLDIMGEGGTVAVIAQRILQGQRPIVDTFLGYNLLWFLPIVGLFKIFGPNFTAVRLFFFALCTLTALLGYRAVLRSTGRVWLAAVVGVLLVLVPGMQFRNYMGFLGVANLACLLEVFVLPQPRLRGRLAWAAVAAAMLGITFLIRIDLGIFFLLIALAGIVLNLGLGQGGRAARLATSGVFLVLIPGMFIATHEPVDVYAARHGFRAQFRAQYEYYVSYLAARFHDLATKLQPNTTDWRSPRAGLSVRPALQPVAGTPATGAADNPQNGRTVQDDTTLQEGKAEVDRRMRPLPPLRDVFLAERSKQRELAFIIYYPVFAAGLIGTVLAGLFVLAFRRPSVRASLFSLFIALASTLTLFPQYLFFRPDPPHVSEMMCPFMVFAGLAAAPALARCRKSRPAWLRIMASVWLLLTAVHLGIYTRYGLGRPSMGSIAIKQPHEVKFTADNGVVAYLPPDQKMQFQQLYRLIHRYAAPDDYVICYPYGPTVNFMTNRPSYQWNLYVDNVTRPDGFDAFAIGQIEHYRPAVVLVDDVPMNETPSSRFSVWAAPTLAYLRQHYHYAGFYVRNEVYVRDFNHVENATNATSGKMPQMEEVSSAGCRVSGVESNATSNRHLYLWHSALPRR
ncbi:MAG: hypothetical protein JO015_10620 [Verrucomicrobia bacterium]|nr:hypothetical protein [Verrucomicrobiota bacterium]